MQAVKGMKTLRPRCCKTPAKDRERFNHLKGIPFQKECLYCLLSRKI